MIDVIEDAVLDALEQGANPPSAFEVRVPWDVWMAVPSGPLRVAGLLVFIEPGNPEDPPAVWTQ